MGKESQATHKPISINRILEKDFVEEPPILHKGILPAGGGLILAGDSGVGKSLLRVEMSVRLCIGLDCFGMKTTHAQTVLIFQTENTSRQEQFRTRRVMQGLGIEKLPDRIYYAPPLYKSSLLSENFIKSALNMIRETKATVVFFDPLIGFYNVPENDNTRMRNVLDAITYLNRQTGVASIIIHYFGKPAAGVPVELKYRMRGAMSIRDWSDSAITISRIEDHASHSDLLRLDFIKIRNGPYHPPIVLERDRNFVHHVTTEPGKCSPPLVIKLVKEHGPDIYTQNDLIRVIQQNTGCSRRTAFNGIKKALGEGYVTEMIVDGRKIYEPAGGIS